MDYSLTTTPPGTKYPVASPTDTPPGANDPGVSPGSITPPAILPTDNLNATLASLTTRLDAYDAQAPLGTTEDLGELVNGDIRPGYTLVLNSDGSGLPKQIWYWDAASAAANDGVQVLQASGHSGNGRYVLTQSL